jgi:LCP family protein required for cell wall assembly
MGLTQRTTEPARTDTLLVMDIDPPHHRINMLSVPRDLWVNIPQYGEGKLAIAYEVGGPKLAAYTLERELGIPVDYTLALTFRGFIDIVDAMGGVTVDVPQDLDDPTYPCLVGYDYCPLHIKKGRQHMDGKTALKFVRERHAYVQQDLARVRNQQAFSDAMKHALLSPLAWPRYPAILKAVERNLITNIPLNALPAVGVQYAMPLNQVRHEYINVDNGMVKPDWSQDGQSILLPADSSAIPNLVHRLFADPVLTQENAAVAVLNGTGTPGAAGDVQTTLQRLGFHTILTGNADGTGYRRSQVIVNASMRGHAEYTARRLQRLLGASMAHRPLRGQTAKIVVILGSESVFSQ